MSGSVFLNNLDDFIVPSQACVNPLVAPKLGPAELDAQAKVKGESGSVGVHVRTNSKKHGRVTLQTDFSHSDLLDFSIPAVPSSAAHSATHTEPDLIKTKTSSSAGQRAVATVSLNDCLACSGCVTSAESVLIQEQSNDKFVKLLEERDPGTVVVVQISPNSRASIADFLEMSPTEFFLRVAAMLKRLGVQYVLDAAAGNDVALVESREEFLHRLRNGRSKEWVRPDTSVAQSSSSVSRPPSGAAEEVSTVALSPHLPLLTSHCPGWVCYAEKTSPQAIPYMSTVKSPQQIVGTIVKTLVLSSAEQSRDEHAMEMDGEGEEDGLAAALRQLCLADMDLGKHSGCCAAPPQMTSPRKKVVVVSIQPCFDKKLEASRKDFFHSESEVNEVDLVLSTAELWQLIEMYAWKSRADDPAEQREQRLQSAPLDFDAQVSGKKLRRNEDEDAATESVPRQRSGSLRSLSFKNVLDFLHSLEPDAAGGRDEIERLFRCVSARGEEILCAAERNAGSGAYTEYLFRHCAEKVYGVSLWDTPLQYIEGRNADYAELDIAQYVDLTAPQAIERPKLRFAKAYGFRNIQSLLMKMKRGAADVDLVEISACPSGCNNGGGQLKALSSMVSLATNAAAVSSPPRAETSAESRDRVRRVEEVFHQPLRVRDPDDSPLVRYLYDSARLSAPLSEAARKVLHTRYHAVPKLETIAPLAAKW